MSEQGLRAARAKMAAAGVADDAVSVFAHYYRQVEAGELGMITEDEIEPVEHLDSLADITDDAALHADVADVTALIKLNGGLGTSMGLDRAKSLLPVKNGLTFLDIIVQQTLRDRERLGARLPLIFMNSFRTRGDVKSVLAGYPDLAVADLPVDFLQSREPKLLADSLEPVEWPEDPELEWCPPGHGDVYPALRASGLLAHLLESGYRYAFCSNSDNLGATFDPRIPVWMEARGTPFLLESCRRIPADRKGGHLARRRSDGRLILRETAQTSSEDMASLQNLRRHRYSNTNNLWLDLAQLSKLLDERDGVLDLPLIRNTKPVDPRQPDSPRILQLETAMGAAVQCFDGARSLVVDRSRFVPVKTTNDLLVLRSDAYTLDSDARLRVADGRQVGRDPFVDLDRRYFALIADFDDRFPAGPVSLSGCDRFAVSGDVRFGADIVVRGDVAIDARGEQLKIESGSLLS